MDAPDVTQLPQAGSVQAPDSGTYGVKAAAEQLQSGLQAAQAPGSTPPSAPPVSTLPGGAKPQPSTGPFGLPAAITAPTQSPDIPVATPLAQPYNPVANAADASQKRLAFLDMLSRNPDVSDTTRELAQTLMSKLIQATKR